MSAIARSSSWNLPAGASATTQPNVPPHHYVTPDVADSLTPREDQVLGLVGLGLTNREIGLRLGIAEKTVKNTVTMVLAKLGLQRRTQAAIYVTVRRIAADQPRP